MEGMPSPHLYTNRLIQEKSPYLLQHAHNPVDWYPWGEEAFEAAQSAGKPIFLSIGYATCHWCHRMARESFENGDLARLMNETFVNVKVDREERPEIDHLYMECAQAMLSGEAGWPLNVILTPDLKPFFAVTYTPPESGRGSVGLKQLLLRIRKIWEDPEDRERIEQQAGKVVDLFSSRNLIQGEELPEKEEIEEAAEWIFKLADPIYGGLRGTPKFPIGYQAPFLLRFVRATKESRALFYVEKSLEMMRRGGIHDHVGGGFARYSVDEGWFLPHFEKMLYDNAVAARVYTEMWNYTRQEIYREVARETLRYLQEEMQDANGGFYSAQDSDTEGHEGIYYTWTWEEIHALLGEEAELFCEYYGVSPKGNFEGRSILYIEQSLEEFAEEHNLEVLELGRSLQKMLGVLREARKKRVAPAKDDKMLCSWNGLAIHAFAEGGRVFQSDAYLKVARRAAEWVRGTLLRDGMLFHRWREGEVRFDGTLEDYAFYIHGLLSLFEAGEGIEWLELSLQLTELLEREFKAEEGAFYLSNGKDPTLLLRTSSFYDGPEPSGNAVHCENLLRLAQMTRKESYRKQAEDILKAVTPAMELYPPGVCYHLMALERYYDAKAPTLVIALNEQEQFKKEIGTLLGSSFRPHHAVVWKSPREPKSDLLLPEWGSCVPVEGKTALYLCEKEAIGAPLTDLSQMWTLLQN